MNAYIASSSLQAKLPAERERPAFLETIFHINFSPIQIGVLSLGTDQGKGKRGFLPHPFPRSHTHLMGRVCIAQVKLEVRPDKLHR